MTKRVRIQNDGGPGFTTKITDAETGEPLGGIYHARVVEINVEDPLKAMLWAHAPEVDVVADAEIVNRCVYCGTQKPDPKTLSDKFRVKLTVDDTDLDLSIEKLKRLQDLQRATRGAGNLYPAEAVTAFVGWLREREGSPFSGPFAGDELQGWADLFCDSQGWRFDQDYYNDMLSQIKANYPD